MFDRNLREQQPQAPEHPFLESLRSLAHISNQAAASLLYPLSGEGFIERRQIAHDIRAQAEHARNFAEVDLEEFMGTGHYPEDADAARIAAAEALRLNQEANQRLYAQQMNRQTAGIERRVRPQTALPQLGRPMTDEQMVARVAADKLAVDNDRKERTGDQGKDQQTHQRGFERVPLQDGTKRQGIELPKLSFGPVTEPERHPASDNGLILSEDDYVFYDELLRGFSLAQLIKEGQMTQAQFLQFKHDRDLRNNRD